MTKKDYELIAGGIRAQRSEIDTWHVEAKIPATQALIELSRVLALRLGERNALFNTHRFMQACGFPNGLTEKS